MITENCLSDSRAASMLAALGSEVRLRVFRLVLRAGAAGLNVSEIQRATGIPPSTLGHHVTALASAGLLEQERVGRELICRARFLAVRHLSAFLLAECCLDADASAAAPTKQPDALAMN